MVLAVSMAAVMMAGCGSSSSGTTAGTTGAADAKASTAAVTEAAKSDGGSGSSVTLKVGDNWGETHPMAKALDEVFKKQIEEKTNGSVKVEV